MSDYVKNQTLQLCFSSLSLVVSTPPDFHNALKTPDTNNYKL